MCTYYLEIELEIVTVPHGHTTEDNFFLSTFAKFLYMFILNILTLNFQTDNKIH